MRFLVIEDHALVREGLVLALKALEEPGQTLAIEGVANAEEANALLNEDDDFDLIVLDLMLPGTSGMAYLGALRKRYPHIPVVVLSALDDVETVCKAMRQGAAGFISKASPTDTLLTALREVLAGEIWWPPAYREMIHMRRRPKTVAERFGLTRSQARVLELLAEGKTNREIGELLNVTEGTVKIHVSAIFKALGVTNRAQALLIAQGKQLAP
ncbi:MAG: response regulator transcription factor [Rhodocyclaceae bacterium]|nr:response regulator transcription factor [Rhodocyclaceae bacterium]